MAFILECVKTSKFAILTSLILGHSKMIYYPYMYRWIPEHRYHRHLVAWTMAAKDFLKLIDPLHRILRQILRDHHFQHNIQKWTAQTRQIGKSCSSKQQSDFCFTWPFYFPCLLNGVSGVKRPVEFDPPIYILFLPSFIPKEQINSLP